MVQMDDTNSRSEEMYNIDSRLEDFFLKKELGYKKWGLFIKQSIRNVDCTTKHDSYMFQMIDYLKEEDGLVCILAEEDAAKVIGIYRPDLLAVYDGGGSFSEDYRFRLIEAQNGKKMKDMVRKTLRYGPFCDEFSIVMGTRNMSRLISSWKDPFDLELDQDIYAKHLQLLGFVDEELVLEGGQLPDFEVRGNYRMKNGRIDVSIKMAEIAKGIDMSLYECLGGSKKRKGAIREIELPQAA